MVNKRDVPVRERLAGLWASIIAVAALTVTLLADNHNAGFGHAVTRGQQTFLLSIASLLLAVQVVAYLIHRAKRPTNGVIDSTASATRSAKKRS